MSPRPNADFLRGLLAAYTLYLAWINAGALWLGLGLWFKYHHYAPLQVWFPLALGAAHAFACGALAFPGRRRLLAAALLLAATALLPLVLLAIYWRSQPRTAILPGFLANEAVRAAVAGAAWFLFRRAERAPGS